MINVHPIHALNSATEPNRRNTQKIDGGFFVQPALAHLMRGTLRVRGKTQRDRRAHSGGPLPRAGKLSPAIQEFQETLRLSPQHKSATTKPARALVMSQPREMCPIVPRIPLHN
jgi:hypothetical protein